MMATIWDWERGEVVRTIDTSANLVAFDSTGARIATSRLVEAIVDVWDAQTGDRVATLTGPASDRGPHLQPGWLDRGDRATATERCGCGTLRRGSSGWCSGVTGRQVVHVVFGPDGSTLTSVSEDGIVRVWALDLDDLIGIADERLTRELSDDECRQYLHLERCPAA